MSLAAQLRRKIERIGEAKVFGYADLGIAKSEYQTAAKALERLQQKGMIKKLSKGIFYRPKLTVFGELKPDYTEQMKMYLYKNGKRVGYETGASLYNRLNLTTQVSAETRIAIPKGRINIANGMLRAKSVKSYAKVTDDNIQLLGLLDALKDIKRIPDSNIDNSIKILSGKIRELSNTELNVLVKSAIGYPPRVRALLGAILENQGKTALLPKLRSDLNPLTSYKLGVSSVILPAIKNWNIK